jgi:hypothetical protein
MECFLIPAWSRSMEEYPRRQLHNLATPFTKELALGTTLKHLNSPLHRALGKGSKMENIVIGTTTGDLNAQLQERGLHSTRSPPARKTNKQGKLGQNLLLFSKDFRCPYETRKTELQRLEWRSGYKLFMVSCPSHLPHSHMV